MGRMVGLRWGRKRDEPENALKSSEHRWVDSRGRSSGGEVLCVGAYERDNFGDLLFLEVTSALLAGARVTASAPLASDMSQEFGKSITPYSHELRSRQFDVVWTVGGELGRVNTSAALKYSLPSEVWRAVTSLEGNARQSMVAQLTGMPAQDLVYVPDLELFPRNQGARQVIHSAGLSGIATLRPEQQERLRSRLARASAITVRDEASQTVLNDLGIDADLSPDVVHALPILFPKILDDRHDGVCFHAAAGYLQRAGTDRVAEALVGLAKEADTHVVLFVAGTAAGHDSVHRYEAILDRMKAIEPGVSVEISSSRDPLRLAQQVAGSRAWIGTSLHGRIIAASAGVPRISLSKAINKRDEAEKTARYARTWDPEMPYSVPLDQLQESYRLAVSDRLRTEAGATGDKLTLAAIKQGRYIATRVMP